MYILVLCLSLVHAQDYATLPSGLRDSCLRWPKIQDQLQAFPSAAQGCLDQITASSRVCRDDVGPRDAELSKLVVDAGAAGAARAQERAYSLGRIASESQASKCAEEPDKITRVCNELYRDLQSARRSNQTELDRIERATEDSSPPEHGRVLASLQEYRRIDKELGQTLIDTQAAQDLGVRILNNMVACQIANARIYDENARQAEDVSYAIGNNQPPSEPDDKRSIYDKYGKPIRDWAEETVTSAIVSTPFSEGARRLAPAAVGGPAGLAIDAGANILSPTRTSGCDGLKLDPIKAYDKGCRINTFRPQGSTSVRSPATDGVDEQGQDE